MQLSIGTRFKWRHTPYSGVVKGPGHNPDTLWCHVDRKNGLPMEAVPIGVQITEMIPEAVDGPALPW